MPLPRLLLLVMALAPLAACADGVLAPTPVDGMRAALAPAQGPEASAATLPIRVCFKPRGSSGSPVQPLYFVDGQPVASVSDVDLGQIDAIEVIRAPDAVARFGSRAAGGVVIITMRQPPRAEAGGP